MPDVKGVDAPVEWLWWGTDENGKGIVSFGRWQSHKCQHRYKYALPQPTEHDYSSVPDGEDKIWQAGEGEV